MQRSFPLVQVKPHPQDIFISGLFSLFFLPFVAYEASLMTSLLSFHCVRVVTLVTCLFSRSLETIKHLPLHAMLQLPATHHEVKHFVDRTLGVFLHNQNRSLNDRTQTYSTTICVKALNYQGIKWSILQNTSTQTVP